MGNCSRLCRPVPRRHGQVWVLAEEHSTHAISHGTAAWPPWTPQEPIVLRTQTGTPRQSIGARTLALLRGPCESGGPMLTFPMTSTALQHSLPTQLRQPLECHLDASG